MSISFKPSQSNFLLRLNAETRDAVSKSFERLSSGLRINDASDDAAGLMVADGLRNDRRLYSQSVRNINDAISLISVASSAIDVLKQIATRVGELAQQSANGLTTDSQREALDTEAQAMREEFDRIVSSAQFNGVKLLDGSRGSISVQTGITSAGSTTISLTDLTNSGLFETSTFSTGLGTFTNSLTYGLDGYRDLRFYDVNNDGTLDSVAPDNDGFEVRIGNGNGTFQGVTAFNWAGYCFQATTDFADFNNDGKIDLVGHGSDGQTAQAGVVFLGNGNGTFGAYLGLNTGDQVGSSSRAGDFNEDGKEDVLITTALGGLRLFFGNGNGTFAAQTTLSISRGNNSNQQQGYVVDVTGDGVEDIVHINLSYGATAEYYDVWVGNGDGTFKKTFSGATDSVVYNNNQGDSRFADMNGDGKIDMITASQNFGDTYLFLGNGNGTFNGYSVVRNASDFGYVEVGDLDGDGNQDIVTTSSSNYFTIIHGNGDGTFKTAISIGASSSGGARSPTLGDLNNDGTLDFGFRDNGAATGWIFLQDSDPSLSVATEESARAAISEMKDTVEALGALQGQLGAYLSRFEVIGNYNAIMRTNLAEAESRIRDLDVAEEVAKLVRNQVKSQAQTALLAQANLEPSLVLKLLK